MILYILRHGIAEKRSPSGDDAARRLTEQGKDRTRAVATGLKAAGCRPDALVTSPLPRASETAEIVAATLGDNLTAQVLPELAPDVAPSEALTALKPFGQHQGLMIVGHEPALSSIASLLLTGSPGAAAFNLRKAGLIALEVPDGFGRGKAEILFMLTPRQLRRMRK